MCPQDDEGSAVPVGSEGQMTHIEDPDVDPGKTLVMLCREHGEPYLVRVKDGIREAMTKCRVCRKSDS